MVFSSTEFIFFFFPLITVLYKLIGIRKKANPERIIKIKNYLLLLASLAFYTYGEPKFVFIMILLVIINWGLALLIEKSEQFAINLQWIRNAFFLLAIIANLSVLFFYKYLGFTSDILKKITGIDFGATDIVLPIGISFFTFQILSYTADVYMKKVSAQHNVLYVMLYVSFFPQLIAGPIVRYNQIEAQILKRNESFDNFAYGMQRFIYGLAKKVLIADYLGKIATNHFDYLSDFSVVMAWIGALAYTFQIYFDFSGYSDMAIGLGKIFGFSFEENFNYPYISKSITEFWRRWHISLSQWFRDYVYIPLGGNRTSKKRWIFNLFIVWLLTGIWHGANWTFIIWGLLYFILLLVEKLTGLQNKLGVFGYLYCLLFVIIEWVIFRAKSVGSALHYLGCMFGISATGFCDGATIFVIEGTWFVFLLAFVGCTPLIKNLWKWLSKYNLGWLESLWVMFIFVLSILHVVGSTYNPFIYFNF